MGVETRPWVLPPPPSPTKGEGARPCVVILVKAQRRPALRVRPSLWVETGCTGFGLSDDLPAEPPNAAGHAEAYETETEEGSRLGDGHEFVAQELGPGVKSGE